MTTLRPAFYAARGGGVRDWWTILHPPYTAWHLAYVVIGATLAPHTSGARLAGTLLAFFLAVGIAAHAFDELHGRPLHTDIPASLLVGAGVFGLLGAMAIGVAGVATVGPGLLVFVALGPVLVLGYNLELFGGAIHTDWGFAAAWGAFPVVTAYYAQAERVDAVAVLAALAALGLSLAQRHLSTHARFVRRQVRHLDGAVTLADGTRLPLDEHLLLAPVERALRSLTWSVVVLAAAVATARML